MTKQARRHRGQDRSGRFAAVHGRRVLAATWSRFEEGLRQVARLPFLRVPDWLEVAWAPRAWVSPHSIPVPVRVGPPLYRRP